MCALLTSVGAIGCTSVHHAASPAAHRSVPPAPLAQHADAAVGAPLPETPLPSGHEAGVLQPAVYSLTGHDADNTTRSIADDAGNPWTSLRTIWFFSNRSDLEPPEILKVSEIVRYMESNPAAELGIDSTTDDGSTEPADRALNERRIDTIRDAMITAGIPFSKIQVGAYGATGSAIDRRVIVLVRVRT
jgi:outer membrane protein OmpA-like peptidoglycan-associated protein